MLKQLFHIDSGQAGDPSQQVLSLRLGPKHCSFVVTDLTGNQLYKLAYYAHDDADRNIVAEIFGNHAYLNEPYYKVLAGYDYPQSTLVPLTLYKKEDCGSLLSTLYGVNGSSAIISEPVKDWDLYNVYAVPKEMHEWMNKKFSSGNYWHQYTISIRGKREVDNHGLLLVDLRPDDFTIIAFAAGKLLLAQTFIYSTPEDILYYLLKVCQENNLSQEQVKLLLSGLIEKQSVLYKELYQYFIHVEFRNAVWQLPGVDYPAHFFTSLNDLARCAS